MTSVLIDVIWGPLGAALGGIVALVGAWLAGRRSAARKADNERLRANNATRERIDDATHNHIGDNPSPDALAQWLRERGKR